MKSHSLFGRDQHVPPEIPRLPSALLASLRPSAAVWSEVQMESLSKSGKSFLRLFVCLTSDNKGQRSKSCAKIWKVLMSINLISPVVFAHHHFSQYFQKGLNLNLFVQFEANMVSKVRKTYDLFTKYHPIMTPLGIRYFHLLLPKPFKTKM